MREHHRCDRFWRWDIPCPFNAVEPDHDFDAQDLPDPIARKLSTGTAGRPFTQVSNLAEVPISNPQYIPNELSVPFESGLLDVVANTGFSEAGDLISLFDSLDAVQQTHQSIIGTFQTHSKSTPIPAAPGPVPVPPQFPPTQGGSPDLPFTDFAIGTGAPILGTAPPVQLSEMLLAEHMATSDQDIADQAAKQAVEISGGGYNWGGAVAGLAGWYGVLRLLEGASRMRSRLPQPYRQPVTTTRPLEIKSSPTERMIQRGNYRQGRTSGGTNTRPGQGFTFKAPVFTNPARPPSFSEFVDQSIAGDRVFIN